MRLNNIYGQEKGSNIQKTEVRCRDRWIGFSLTVALSEHGLNSWWPMIGESLAAVIG
jgi:hypothetical protein